MNALLIAAAMLAPHEAASPTSASFDPARLSNHVRLLASDEFEGRAPGTAGEDKTVAYLVDQLKRAGFQPGGELVRGGKRGWTQAVPLLRASIVGQPRISIDGTALSQGKEIAVAAPRNGESRISIRDAPLVFVGYGVKAPERDWDDFKGQDMRGKILVVLTNDPDLDTGEGTFGGKAMTYYGRWTYKLEEAARQGALGALLIHEFRESGQYSWDVVKSIVRSTMFDVVVPDPEAAHAPIEAWIQLDEAKKLIAASGHDFEALKKAAQKRDFKPVPLKAKFSAEIGVSTEVTQSRNVIGRLPGAKRPQESIIYSAHWDHLGIGEPDAKGDRIYNGARDNATGLASLIELARRFGKAPRPERSVVILAVTAEEKGLLGSTYYAANPLYPLAQTVGVMNMDALELYGPAKNFIVNGSAKDELLSGLITHATRHGRTFTSEPRPENGGYFRSDHFPFAKAGVPALSWKSGNDLLSGGVARHGQLADQYTVERYHRPADEWKPEMDFGGIAADLAILYDYGRALANSKTWPNWRVDSEFRPLRDAQRPKR